MNKKEKQYLQKLYNELKNEQTEYNSMEHAETRRNGYRIGRINGQIALIEKLLNISSDVVHEKEKMI